VLVLVLRLLLALRSGPVLLLLSLVGLLFLLIVLVVLSAPPGALCLPGVALRHYHHPWA
jgi:hypothetical protein